MRSIYDIELPAAVSFNGSRAVALKWSKNGKKILIEKGPEKSWEDVRYVEPLDEQDEVVR